MKQKSTLKKIKQVIMPWSHTGSLEEFEAQIETTVNLLLLMGLISAMLAVLLFTIPIEGVSAALTTVIAVSAITLSAVSLLMIAICGEMLDKERHKRKSEVDQLEIQKDRLNQVLSLRVKNKATKP